MLQYFLPFEKYSLKFRPWDGTCDLTYRLDQCIGWFKDAVNEVALQCTEEKEIGGCKVRPERPMRTSCNSIFF
jgi:hypothetical protein